MLLQTNSYIVAKEKRAEHARLMRRFRQVLSRLGCNDFEVYEQVGANWAASQPTGRFVQIMRFRDRKHQVAVQNAERNDPSAQEIIAEFCELVNYQYQVQQNLFAVGFYSSVLPVAPVRAEEGADEYETPAETASQPAEPGVPQRLPEDEAAAPVGPANGRPPQGDPDIDLDLELDAFSELSDPTPQAGPTGEAGPPSPDHPAG